MWRRWYAGRKGDAAEPLVEAGGWDDSQGVLKKPNYSAIIPYRRVMYLFERVLVRAAASEVYRGTWKL